MEDSARIATFFFTDIEGSTRLWEREPERMRPAMARHDALAREAVEKHRGEVVKKTGDGLHAAFRDPLDALLAAVELQRGLAALAAESGFEVRARCGLHAGAFERRDGDYYGSDVNRAARIMSAAHGGQVLVSNVVAELLAGRCPAGYALRDLGRVRLRDLARPEQLHQVVAPGLASEHPALRSLERTPNNLPHSLTSFVGREHELTRIRELLGRGRLLTVTGMGGLGKTRLALRAAVDEMDRYPDGAWLVELAALRDPRRVGQAVASAIGVKEEPGAPVIEALERHVRDRKLLVMLDNCEHLLEACAQLARRLLLAGESVSVLATSREPLRVPGEVLFAIGGMALPEGSAADAASIAGSEAVRLFLDRACAVRPGFAVTQGNARAIASICRDLDGIPLALELAAARVRSLPVEEIAARMGDRFRIASKDPTVAARQRTMKALIDWSYDLLTQDERAMFRQLAVFESGCTLEAVETVCELPGRQPVLAVLEQLVEKSLVLMDEEGPRYRMLETVRQYALERLQASPEHDAIARRHFDYCLRLADEARARLVGPERGPWLAILDRERENILAAHAWAARGAVDAPSGLRLASCMKHYWISRGLLELGERVTLEALERPGAQARDADRCRALFDAGQMRYFMARYAEARALLGESLAIARELGSAKKVAGVLQPLGMAALGEGDRETARACLDEALALARSLRDDRGVATAANALGQLCRLESAPQDAARLFEESIAISRASGDREMVAVGLLNLAMVSVEREGGRFARVAATEALSIAEELGSQPLAKSVLEVAAGLAAIAGDDRAAARFYGAAEAHAERTGLRRDPADSAFLLPLVERARARLGPAAFSQQERAARSAGDSHTGAVGAWLSGASLDVAPICR